MSKFKKSSNGKSSYNGQNDQKNLSEEEKKEKAKKAAIKEMYDLRDTIQSAVDNNTFNGFIDNRNQVATIPRRMEKNIGYALKNLKIMDKFGRKFHSASSLSFNEEIDEQVFKLQGLLLKVSNKDCPRTPKTSYFYEIWRLYLKSAIDGCLIIRAINEANIGAISNYPLESVLFNHQDLTSSTKQLDGCLTNVSTALEVVDRRLKGILNQTNQQPDKFDIQGMEFVVRKTDNIPKVIGGYYNDVKAAEKDLGELFNQTASIDNQNHHPLKIKTLMVVSEVLRRYLKMILITRNLMDVDPLAFIQVYLEDRKDLGENAKKMIQGITEVMNWLISHNGVVNHEGREFYRKTIQDLTQLPCDPKHGEFLSIVEIDKMNLNCFNKIQNLTSWDLIVLELLKGQLFRLNVIFNSIYDVNMANFSKITQKGGVQ